MQRSAHDARRTKKSHSSASCKHCYAQIPCKATSWLYRASFAPFVCVCVCWANAQRINVSFILRCRHRRRRHRRRRCRCNHSDWIRFTRIISMFDDVMKTSVFLHAPLSCPVYVYLIYFCHASPSRWRHNSPFHKHTHHLVKYIFYCSVNAQTSEHV